MLYVLSLYAFPYSYMHQGLRVLFVFKGLAAFRAFLLFHPGPQVDQVLTYSLAPLSFPYDLLVPLSFYGFSFLSLGDLIFKNLNQVPMVQALQNAPFSPN